jgi:hypothetical protein
MRPHLRASVFVVHLKRLQKTARCKKEESAEGMDGVGQRSFGSQSDVSLTPIDPQGDKPMLELLLLALLSEAGVAAQSEQASTSAGARPTLAAMIIDAVRQADSPPSPETLRQVCATQVNVGGLSPVITFVASANGPVVLATLTEFPLVDVRRDIALKTDLRLPWPPSGTIDWMYVFDHDSDGRIDHIAYFVGPMAMEPPNPPRNLPSLSAPGPVLGPAEATIVRRYMRDGFWQGFDTDRDGMVDTLAYPAMNKANGWTRGWALITGLASTEQCEMLGPDGNAFESCSETSGGAGGVEDEHGGYEGRTASAHRFALRPDLVWESLQQGARACNLKASDFSHG